MTRYNNPAIKQLKDQQVRYAPSEVRLSQIEKAERLLEDLEPGKTYPYRDICEKITSYRSEMYPDLVLDGKDTVHDLRCFVEDLSDSINLPVEHCQCFNYGRKLIFLCCVTQLPKIIRFTFRPVQLIKINIVRL